MLKHMNGYNVFFPLQYLRLTKYNVEQTFIQKPLPVVVKAYIEISKRQQCYRIAAIHCNAVWHVNVEQNKGLNVFLTKQEIAGQHELYRAIIGKSLTMQITENIIACVILAECQYQWKSFLNLQLFVWSFPTQ